jgi:glucokinase
MLDNKETSQHPENNLAIGAIDIGGTKIAVGIISPQGKILSRYIFPTEAERGPQAAVQRITDSIRQGMMESGTALEGIGIGSTGPVYPESGEFGEMEFLPGWEGYNIVRALGDELGLPAAIENDADAAALGEARWGAGKGVTRFAYVTVSTGIGVGLVFDGQLYRGVEGAHPEIGHMIIDPSGPPCSCGANGCWESLASGTGISRMWQEVTGEQADAGQVFARAETGDKRALGVVRAASRYLGIGLANLVTTLVPEVIALGGGVMRSRALFWQELQADILRYCGYVPAEKVRLVPAGLGEDTALAGAASVWLHHTTRPA